MVVTLPLGREPVAPPPDPQAIRACLTPDVAAAFDAEWEFVLDEALEGYAEVLGVLELAPWSGEPQHKGNPDAAVRRWVFGPDGAGQAVYLILESQCEVHVILVL